MKQNRILKGLFNIMMNSSYFLSWIYILDEEICDPMEKI